MVDDNIDFMILTGNILVLVVNYFQAAVEINET